MIEGGIESTIFGGPEGSMIKIQLSDDALGLGRGDEGVAREIRRGPEGLLDRTNRFYELMHAMFASFGILFVAVPTGVSPAR